MNFRYIINRIPICIKMLSIKIGHLLITGGIIKIQSN